MNYLTIDNTGANTAEIEIQTGDSTVQHYINPEKSYETGQGYLFTLRSAEGGDLTVDISNTSEQLIHHVYIASASVTRRQRALMPGQRRTVRINGDDRFVLLPVGSREE
ncbi:MAG: hypothetical protein VR78_04845 [Hoeflea sp. BRH_c9]|nr:MAG: hypothetical protein VR78_04845 [Hoeflea sp. BRH_c9]